MFVQAASKTTSQPSVGGVTVETESLDACARFEGWEEWDRHTPLWKHAAAGSCAGVMEHIGLYPFDTIKTHMQALRPSGRPANLAEVLREIAREQGGLGFMRGCSAIATGCIPAHIALFSSYELSKQQLLSGVGEHEPLRAAACGAAANICHDAILTPMDLVKQRMQLGQYNSIGDCLTTVLRSEGIGAFYRSMSTTLVMNVPYGSVLVAANESLKLALELDNPSSSSSSGSSSKRLMWYFAAAGASGALASCLTQPFDVVKTRLQTQDFLVEQRSAATATSSTATSSSASPDGASAARGEPRVKPVGFHCSHAERDLDRRRPKYLGFKHAVKTIVREEGFAALWRGTFPRMVYAAPAAGLCWGTYETVKSAL